MRSGVSYLASCKTLASTGLFHFSPFHLRRLGQEPPPTPRYGSERSRNFAFDLRHRASSNAAADAFALQHRCASRHRDVTAPLVARAAPRRRRRTPQLGSGYLGWAAQQFSARARAAGTPARRRRRPTAAWPWPRATRRPTRAARATKRRQTPSRRRPHMQQGSFRSTRRDGRSSLRSPSIVYARRRCCFSISWR